jgi:hypothetical protein
MTNHKIVTTMMMQEHADVSEQALAKAKTRSRAGSIGPVRLKRYSLIPFELQQIFLDNSKGK